MSEQKSRRLGFSQPVWAAVRRSMRTQSMSSALKSVRAQEHPTKEIEKDRTIDEGLLRR